MEELVLTEPVTATRAKYKVISLTFDLNHPSGGLVGIRLEDNLGVPFFHSYDGQAAKDYIKFVNTANFTTKSLHKRILERLSTEGVIPGTVTGAPDA